MKSNGRFQFLALIGAAIFGLLIMGCSTEAPFQPTYTNQSASADQPAIAGSTETDSDTDIYPPDDDPDLGPPSLRTSTTGQRDSGDLNISIQPNKASDVEFEGIVFGLDLIDSTITFFTFTSDQWVGLVTASTELVDTAGNPVAMADFQICMMSDVQGIRVSADTLELVHVVYRSF